MNKFLSAPKVCSAFLIYLLMLGCEGGGGNEQAGSDASKSAEVSNVVPPVQEQAAEVPATLSEEMKKDLMLFEGYEPTEPFPLSIRGVKFKLEELEFVNIKPINFNLDPEDIEIGPEGEKFLKGFWGDFQFIDPARPAQIKMGVNTFYAIPGTIHGTVLALVNGVLMAPGGVMLNETTLPPVNPETAEAVAKLPESQPMQGNPEEDDTAVTTATIKEDVKQVMDGTGGGSGMVAVAARPSAPIAYKKEDPARYMASSSGVSVPAKAGVVAPASKLLNPSAGLPAVPAGVLPSKVVDAYKSKTVSTSADVEASGTLEIKGFGSSYVKTPTDFSVNLAGQALKSANVVSTGSGFSAVVVQREGINMVDVTLSGGETIPFDMDDILRLKPQVASGLQASTVTQHDGNPVLVFIYGGTPKDGSSYREWICVYNIKTKQMDTIEPVDVKKLPGSTFDAKVSHFFNTVAAGSAVVGGVELRPGAAGQPPTYVPVIVALESDLKKILWTLYLGNPTAAYAYFSDLVQLPNGVLLAYVNDPTEYDDKGKPKEPVQGGTMYYVNPRTGQIITTQKMPAAQVRAMIPNNELSDNLYQAHVGGFMALPGGRVVTRLERTFPPPSGSGAYVDKVTQVSVTNGAPGGGSPGLASFDPKAVFGNDPKKPCAEVLSSTLNAVLCKGSGDTGRVYVIPPK